MYLDHINQLRMLIHGPYIKRHVIKLAGIKLHRTLIWFRASGIHKYSKDLHK